MKTDNRQRMQNLFFGTDSLTKRLTVEAAEAANSVVLADFGPTPIPFGALHPQWQRLKAKMRPGDELWEFLSIFPRGDGLRGVKLIRAGKVIDSIGAQWVPVPQAVEPKHDSGPAKKARPASRRRTRTTKKAKTPVAKRAKKNTRRKPHRNT